MKKKLYFSLAMLIMIMPGCGKKEEVEEIPNDIPQTEQKSNTNDGVISDKTMGGLVFTNSSLVYDENNSILKTVVTNTTNENIVVRIFNIYVKDENGNLITTLLGYVGGEIPAGQSREIETKIDSNLEKAYTIEYEIVND